METLFASVPLWITYIVVTNPAYEATIRRSSLLSWINVGELTLEARMLAGGAAVFMISLIVFMIIGRRLSRWAFDPQIKEELTDWQFNRLTEIARSRKQGRLIDADYRTVGWNQSKFAPKKNGSSMRDVAVFGGAVFGGMALLFGWSTDGLNIGTMLFSLATMNIVTAYVAASVRRKEWRRIKPIVLQSMRAADPWKRDIPYQTPISPDWMQPPPSSVRSGPSFEFDLRSTTAYRDFEREVAYLIHKQTGLRTEVVGGAGDQGIDIKVYDGQQRLVGVVQCKNYATNAVIGPSIVREMIGVKQVTGARTAYLVTSARFSETARQLAEQYKIKLMDGNDLAEIRARANLARPQTLNGMWDEPTTPAPPPQSNMQNREPTPLEQYLQRQNKH